MMGDIGKPLRKIELEPIPDDIPVTEPSPGMPQETEPVLVPASGAPIAGI